MTNFIHSLLLTALSPKQVGPPPPVIIRCDVVFGAPRLNCNGTGICKIINSALNPDIGRKKGCRRSPALLSSQNGTEVSLVLYREFVCLNVYKNHLRNGMLDMSESCVLPEDVVTELGLNGNVLAPGMYSVEEMNSVFRITLKIQTAL